MKRIVALIAVALLLFGTCSTAFASPAQYTSTQLFLDLLKEKDVSYTYVGIDDNDYEIVTVQNTDSDIDLTYTIKYYFDPNNENAGIRVWDVVAYGENEGDWINALIACDKCNRAWKYITFLTEDDNTVTAKMDLIYRGESVSEVVWEATLHMTNVIGRAYPEYLAALNAAA